MKIKKNALALIFVIFVAGFMFSFMTTQDKKDGGPWDIPEKYKNMENKFKGDASLNKVGRILYLKHCRSCHGSKGEGDGPKAASMKTNMRSLKSAEFQAQTDGVIYYQSIIGRNEMPNYESKIPDEEDRWALVNYMRTLK